MVNTGRDHCARSMPMYMHICVYIHTHTHTQIYMNINYFLHVAVGRNMTAIGK